MLLASCPYVRSHVSLANGAQNCDHQWRHQHGTLNYNLNSLSQLRTTNQQVHWVVQVINLTRVRVDPTEIVGMKQAMGTL